MTEFENYLEKRIEALQDAPSGASVAGGSVIGNPGLEGVALVNDSNWVAASFAVATVVGVDLAIHSGGLSIDVLSDGLYALTAIGYFEWGSTPNGAGVKFGTTGPWADSLRLENYPTTSGFNLAAVVPLLAGDSITFEGYVDGGDQASPSLYALSFCLAKIGPVPA